jgi:hypothetical protein
LKGEIAMATKKVEQLDFIESDEKSEREFTRYEMEFIPNEEVDIEFLVGEELKQAWDSVAQVAVEGYRKSGRGYVVIIPAPVNNRTRLTGELNYDSCLMNAGVFYVTRGGELDLWNHDYLEDYDPETEIAFVINFSDGTVKGVASFDEVLKKEQARRRHKEKAEDKREIELAANFQAASQHSMKMHEGQV